MFWLVILALIIIGLLFLALEILVIPGTGFAGVLGFILIAIGIWQTYDYYGATPGHVVLAGTIILTFITLALSLRSKTWNRVMLKSSIDSKVNVIDDVKVKPGDEGVAESRLVPAGKALIKGDYFEVRTTGEFIDPGTKLIVTKVEFNKIFVKRKD
jgi:membrane-bound ClpP family serine protease